MTAGDTFGALVEHLRLNPDTTTAEALGATGADPTVWRDPVEDALATDTPHEALESPDTAEVDGGSRDETPTPEADKPPSDDEDEDADGTAEAPVIESGVFPEDLRDVPQWLTWKPTGDGRKVPRAPYLNPDWPDKFVSAQDPEVWTDFATAAEWVDTLPGYGLAFNIRDREAFPAEEYVLIDYDDARDPDTEAVHPVVREHIERAGSYADVSTSGTGVHIFARGGLPDGVKAIDAPLPDAEGFDDAEIEVYDSARFSAMTGDHIQASPVETTDCQAFIDDLAEEYATVAEGTPDEMLREPKKSREEIAEVDTTADIQDVLDAVQHTGPRDIRLRSTVTQERADGTLSMDPSWASSKSGTRLAQVGDGWVYRKGMVGLDALQVVALEERIITREDEYPSGEDFWNAVDALRERGAHIPEYAPAEGDADPVAPFPFAALDTLAGPERKRYARKHGLEIPSTGDARRRLRDAVFRELRAGNRTVIDAPTSLGKSYTVATEAWLRHADVTGEAPVIHTHPTRDARDEAADDTARDGVDGAVLKGRKEISPLARGDHDPPTDADEEAPEQIVTIDGRPASEWFDLMCDAKGLPFSTALALARDRNDQGLDDLPPVGEEDPAVRQWDGIPRTDDGDPAVDVIHATHQFLYVPSLRRHSNVIIDERPDFSVSVDAADDAGLSQDRIRRMVTAYLQEIDAPVSTWEAFVSLARFDGNGNRSDADAEQDAVADALGTSPPTEWFVENPDAHALAPDLTRAIWNALRWGDADGNGRRGAKVFHEPPRLDADGEQYAGTWLSVVVDEDNTVRSVRNAPDLSQARAVVGLDAHPSMSMWELNVGPDMTRDAVLNATERRLWRRYERGLTVVQVGEATRPRSGEKAREWMNDERVRTVLDALREHYGDGFDTAVAPVQVERKVRGILAEVVGDGVDLEDEHTLHYGEEKSRNPEAFVDALAGYIYGCMDPGDDMILDALAELGLDATPRTVETDEGDVKREKGRTFDGPDADTAQELLASVRENHVAQAAGRYARSPDDPDDSAVVYVHTDAVPPGFADIQVPGVEWLATDLQREIIHTLAARPQATTREIADAVDCSKEHVRETLARLEERGLVDRRPEAGDHGADVFEGETTPSAFVDLGTEQTTNEPLKEYSRWSLAVCLLHEASDTVAPDARAIWGPTDARSEGDPPPEPTD